MGISSEMIVKCITVGAYGEEGLVNLQKKLLTAYNCHHFYLYKHVNGILAASCYGPFIQFPCCGLLGADALIVKCPQRYQQ